jgi:hypothetical protein
LSESGTALNVDKAENKDKTLILRDSLEMYHNQTTPQSIRDANLDLVKHATTTKTKVVSILGDRGSFFFKKQIQNLLEYENTLPRNLMQFSKAFVCTIKMTLIICPMTSNKNLKIIIK